MRKIRILEAVNQLGLGGTEYAVQLYAKYLDKAVFEVTVLALLSGGERVSILQDMGIDVINLNGDYTKLPNVLKQTDVLHWHGAGSLDPQFFSAVRDCKPALLIQTNVFGQYDGSPLYNLVDYDLFISKMILFRRMQCDRSLPDSFSKKRKVLPYPVDVDYIASNLPSDEEVMAFRQATKLEGCYVIGRIGRPDDYKFDLIALDGFAEFAKRKPNARFLLVGSTPKMEAYAEQLGITDQLIVLENTVNFKTVLLYYRSIDVYLATSQIGESFGMVIAEAMTVGLPVVTICTENRDNAQVELIDNMINGVVVKRNKISISKAIKFLYNNPREAERLGNAATKKIAGSYRAQKIVRSLESLIMDHLHVESKYAPKEQSAVHNYSEQLADDYIWRCQDLFGRPALIKRLMYRLKRRIRL